MSTQDPLLPELYYIVARFLDGGPCKKAAAYLRKEINEYKLLPKRTDWLGEKHDILFEDMERNCPLESDFLLKLCNNLCKVIDKAVPTALPKVAPTLLGLGRHSALRTNESVCEKRPFFLDEVVNERHGRRLLSPSTTKCPSLTVLATARGYTSQKNMLSIVPIEMYSKKTQLFRRILGHLSSVYCILYDQTGKFIITGADDLLIKIWSAIDGRLLATLRGHALEITDLTLSPDNSMLASGSLDKTIRVWCLRSLRPLAVLTEHTSMVTSLKFCPSSRLDRSFLASTSNDGCVCFWEYDPRKKTFKTEPKKFADRVKQGAQLLCQSFSPGGTLLATGSSDHVVRIYQVFKPSETLSCKEDPERVAELTVHTDRVDSIQFANNDSRFISGSKDGTANIWQFKANKWVPISLKMTTTLENQSHNGRPAHANEGSLQSGNGDAVSKNQKLKVNMVAWTRDDSKVLTSVSDHTVKIWNSRTGALLVILKGHEDDVYALESHPTDRRILYTGGHDGRVIIWDITTGKSLKTFYNLIEGQGHGAMFDLKVSPDGLTFSATDSHGHLSIYGIGSNEAFSKVPDEQFFHTDYRGLVRDTRHHVLDEQTQVAPHLMPAPFLVDIDGNPYPPHIQRLVPGRESCPDELLVPNMNEIRDDDENNRRVNIDDMIQRLQQERHDNSPRPQNVAAARPNEAGTPSSRGGMRRDGEVEGVRQGPSNWHHAGAMNVPRCKVTVKPLTQSEIDREFGRARAIADFELVEYQKEKRKEIPDKVVVNYGLRTKVDNKANNRRTARMTTLSSVRGASLRSAPQEDEPDIIDDEEFDEVGESDSDYEQDSSGRERNRANNRRSQPTVNERPSNARGGTRSRRRGGPVEASGSGSPSGSGSNQVSTSSTEDDTDVSTSGGEHSDNDADAANGTEATDNAQDSVRRSERRKRQTQRRNVIRSSDDSQGSSGQRRRNERAQRSSGRDRDRRRERRDEMRMVNEDGGPRELPEAFRPPDWLTDTIPRRTPYLPQIGDILMYFQQGHQLYFEAVRRNKTYKLKKHYQFHWNRKLRDQEKVRVLDIKFELLPPRLCCVKVECTDPVDASCSEPFWIRYHDMSDVIDFLVLYQTFQTAMEREWKVGDRFRSIIEDKWWLGTIMTHEPIQEEFPDSMFQCFNVKWDNGETERMSPWDFEPVDHTRLPAVAGVGVDITSEEREALQYVPSQEDFEDESRDAFRTRMASGIEKIMSLSIAEAFLVPVDLNSYPMYAMVVAYPMDLSTIRSRLENNFYRRKEGIKFDVSYVEFNANKFNEPGSAIVKQANLLTRVLLHFINDVCCDDPLVIYQRLTSESSPHKRDSLLQEPGHISSDDSGGPGPSRKLYLSSGMYAANNRSGQKKSEANNGVSRRPTTRTTSDWREKCAYLLAMLMQKEDSQPFRTPIDTEEFPDYLEIIDTPMDLTTVSERLTNGEYTTPEDFAKDVQLIFTNSRNYNTNKRSRIYAMTIRLSAMFEDHLRAIMAEHSAACRRLSHRKRYDESDDNEEVITNSKSARHSNISNGKHQVRSLSSANRSHMGASSMNGHHSEPGSSSANALNRRPKRNVFSNTSSSQSNSNSGHNSPESDEEIITKSRSTRSGRQVKPTQFSDMILLSEEEAETRRSGKKTNGQSSGHGLTNSARKRKVHIESEPENHESFSSDDVTPQKGRILKTRSGRTVKLVGSSGSASTNTTSSPSTSNNSSTSDESIGSPVKKGRPVRPPPSKKSRRKKMSSDDEDLDEVPEEDEDILEMREEELAEEEIEDEDEEEEEEISTEGSSAASSQRRSSRNVKTTNSNSKRGTSMRSRKMTESDLDEDDSPQDISDEYVDSSPQTRKTPRKGQTSLSSRGSAIKESQSSRQPVRAARACRRVLREEESDDIDDEDDEIVSKPKKRKTNGNGHMHADSSGSPSESGGSGSGTTSSTIRSRSNGGRKSQASSGGRSTRGRSHTNYCEASENEDDLDEDDEEKVTITSSRGRVCKVNKAVTRAIREGR